MNCYHCVSKPATCIGAYEGAELMSPACDECCGHGCEDGICIRLDALCEQQNHVQAVITAFREWQLTSGAQAEQNLSFLLARVCSLAEFRP
jgi:hypothetical protein